MIARGVSACHYRQLPFGKMIERDFIGALASAAMDAATEGNLDWRASSRMRLAARKRAIEIVIGLHRRTDERLPGVVPRVRIPAPVPLMGPRCLEQGAAMLPLHWR